MNGQILWIMLHQLKFQFTLCPAFLLIIIVASGHALLLLILNWRSQCAKMTS